MPRPGGERAGGDGGVSPGRPRMPVVVAALVVVLGLIVIARTISLGVGGGLGLLLGGLMVLGGGLRLYMVRASWRRG